MGFSKDALILRELAKQLDEISKNSIQEERRSLWRKHNSLKKGKVPILVSMGWWDVLKSEIITEKDLKCEDPFFRDMEFNLRSGIFQDSIEDDSIIEPWFKVPADFNVYGWGVEINHIKPEQSGGSYKFNPPIVDEEDIKKLISPKHSINEEKSKERLEMIGNALGDIMPVVLDRTPCFNGFQADISYWLGQLLGMEEIMYYMYDRPDWLHDILGFFRDGILNAQEEAEKAGDWSLLSHTNQAMTYAEELPDPAISGESVTRNKLWGFFASQEYAMISPQMHYEFLLQYQMPIMEKMGLVAYGCCEDLTKKIDMLRKISNLRRIAVTPWADVAKCAAQIGKDYVMSWRPNPSLMISGDWDPQRIKDIIKKALLDARDSVIDITLKDVITVKNEIWRVKEWVKTVREVTEN